MIKGSVLLSKFTNTLSDPLEIRKSLHVFLAVLVLIYVIQWLIKFMHQLKTLPPGPWGIPVLGFLPFMRREKHNCFMDLAKKYGSVFSTRMGNQLTVVISDYKLIRENFRKQEYSNRPDTPFMAVLGGYGIVNSDGKLWKNERRFLHEKLRALGMTYMGSGRKLMESRIMTEVKCFLQEVEQSEGQPIDIAPALSMAATNVICDMLMSVRFSKEDPLFQRFTFLIEEGMRLFGEVLMVEYLPAIQYLPGVINAKNKIQRNRQEMFDFYRKVINDHRETLDRENVRDLVDMYLCEIEQAKEEGREGELFEGKDHDQQIMQVVADLFSAGMETVKTTLLWMNVFMLRHPDVMAKVKAELDSVVGRSRMPSVDDLPHLPYTESALLEGMRRASIVPLATTHATTKEVEMNGFTIPAGAQVIPLIQSVHMDPTLWDKPEEFIPERFIGPDGAVHRPDFFMPFGVGRRRCLGDTLARMEMFLFFACLMHGYDISLPENEPEPTLTGVAGVVISPQAVRVCIKPRPDMPKMAMFAEEEEQLEQDNQNREQTHADGILRNVGSY